ncbi:DNA alkylation repair protein [Actinokineospora auranticolor]|uniref:3-methyladenine DNA glycosylase AlkD n=1 Tax=Actinokineospora auranticolor TaxID=155976 RepID=A0A2S6GNN8_9PSEU|nr:DNA alkylation repair protein [Actinokineospora auranticolor]PPK66783.1 3-methyladenine DNA glycosylase AlkD [Actinokineospora auranticolor]
MLVPAVRAALKAAADSRRAPEMQRYMKSDMPFRGVPKPVRELALKPVFAAHAPADRAEWISAVGELWREAEFREERYAATDLLAHRVFGRWRDVDMLPLFEEFVVTGAWWDHVDELASRQVGALLLSHRDVVTPEMYAWATDADRWKRRVSVICQLPAKGETDLDLLAHAIESNEDDKDFFLRKGIGWALRQYARVDPGWVTHFVDSHPGLSPLSRREALKHLG